MPSGRVLLSSPFPVGWVQAVFDGYKEQACVGVVTRDDLVRFSGVPTALLSSREDLRGRFGVACIYDIDHVHVHALKYLFKSSALSGSRFERRGWPTRRQPPMSDGTGRVPAALQTAIHPATSLLLDPKL
jgi:hypothetical protein